MSDLLKIFFEMYLRGGVSMNPNDIYWGFDGDIPYVDICIALDITAQIFEITFQEIIQGD